MPVEVIDLLSSPEPPVIPTSKPNAKPKASAVPKLPVPKASSSSERPKPKQGKDGWLSLSSDSEIELAPKPTKPAPVAPSKPAGPPKPTSSNWDAAHRPLQVKDRGNGIFYNSDEFDSTVNFDDSFALSPQPTKKRRLSSSPEILLPKPKQPRASGFQRSVSYAESSSHKRKPQGADRSSTAGLQRSRTIGAVLESDPIVFTSSPDPFEDITRRRRERMRKEEKEDSDDDDDVFGLGASTKETAVKKGSKYDISDGSSDMELPDLADIVGTTGLGATVKKTSTSILDDYYAERAKEKRAKDASEKDKEKQAKRAMKEAEKERKRLEREEKANEKERIAELARVNVVRSNKQKSSHEMTVDIPSKISGSVLGEQAIKLLDKAEIKHSSWESELPLVKWRREVTSDYNEEAGQWEPTPLRIEPEKFVMFVMNAKEFVELAIGEDGEDVDCHVLGLKAKFPTSKVIYLIEGLMPWMRKNKTIQNRKYTETVRSIGREEPTASQRSRKKQEEYVDEDLVEDALLRLQVMHGALIHHTAATVETAEWILVFTQHISTVPYR